MVSNNLKDHEGLHAWQSRIFGPAYQLSYAAWLIVGGVAGLGIGLFTDQPLRQDIYDVAYLDNPWELWAYAVGGTRGGGTLA